MRKIILVILFSLTFCQDLYSWDTTAAKYLPLQVGNVWVYNSTSSGYPGYQNRYISRYRITRTLDTLGHRYYVYDRTIVWIINQNGVSYYQLLGAGLRIDSTTMNVYRLEDYCGRTEYLNDSLKAKPGDINITCSQFGHNSQCMDTIPYNGFNTIFASKLFAEFYGPGSSTRYAKGIGVVRWGRGYGMHSVSDTLIGCVINGVVRGDTNMLVGITPISTEIPERFELKQNYPNPFNPSTIVRYSLLVAGMVTLKIFDVTGREISTLVNEELRAGVYEAEFDGTNYPSGVYYYQLKITNEELRIDYSETRKMVLVK